MAVSLVRSITCIGLLDVWQRSMIECIVAWK